MNNEHNEFFDLINTTKDKQFKAYQIKKYGYLRNAGETVSKKVWNKANKKTDKTNIPSKTTQSISSKISNSKRKFYNNILNNL